MSHERKTQIIQELEQSETPISASTLAEKLGVTRQVIVGDIALLRATGEKIVATPRGYILEQKPQNIYVVSCEHDQDRIGEELYLMVDCGCGVLDVIVEHPLYGQITCNLHLFSRLDVDNFLQKMKETQSTPISTLTHNGHLHTLQCPSHAHFLTVEQALREQGF